MNKNTILSFCVMLTFTLSCLPIFAMKADKKVYEPDFFKSMVSGPVEELEKFVDESGDVHAYDSEGKTLLGYAYLQQKREAVDILLSKGASFDRFGYVRGRYESLLKGFLYADIPEEDRWEAVKCFIENKLVDPNTLFDGGDTPLEFVVRTKMDKKYVSLLIEAGARVDRVSDLKNTPLSWAIQNSLHEHAHLLLKAGAPADFFRWSKKKTPLESAFLNDDIKMMEILLQLGANPDKLSSKLTPLGRALVRDNVAATEILLKYYACLTTPIEQDGLLPLPYALLGHNEFLVELLLKAGANPNSTYLGSKGKKRSMLYAAVLKGPTALRLLLEHGADVNHQDERRNTILHYAAKAQRVKEIGVLLQYGASKTIHNHKGKTPIQCAPERFRQILQNMQTRLKAPKRIGYCHKPKSH